MFDNTRSVASVKPVQVDGIGTIFGAPLRIASEGVNYEKNPETNLHNENAVYINNRDTDLFDDDTTLDFACTPTQCELKIAVNSEVGTDLYNNGYFQLFFDRAAQKWDMKAYRISGFESVEWKFCSPNDSLGHVVSILKFLAIDGEKEVESGNQSLAVGLADVDETLKSLAASIERGALQTVASTPLYAKSEDCTAEPLSANSVDPVDRTVLID